MEVHSFGLLVALILLWVRFITLLCFFHISHFGFVMKHTNSKIKMSKTSRLSWAIKYSFKELEGHWINLGVLNLFSNSPLSLSGGGRTGYFLCLSRSQVDHLPRPSLETRGLSYLRYKHVTP